MLPFDRMFDFDHDGMLDSMERGLEFAFLEEMEQREKEDYNDSQDEEGEKNDE